MQPTLKAIIFDFDGTILDTETTEFRHWQQLYQKHQRELLLSNWQQGIGTWDAFDPWAGLPEEVQGRREEVRAEMHKEMLAEIAQQDLREGVRGVLEAVKASGLKLALATSSDKKWVTGWLEQHQLLALFDVIVTRDNVAQVKPNPELYLLAAQHLGLHPNECLAVEDSLNGATAAIAAGMPVVVVPNEVTQTQPFMPTTPCLNNGYASGLAGLIKAGWGS